MEQYISSYNTFPESCRVTFKLFSGFAKRQNIHRTQQFIFASSSSSALLMRVCWNRFISKLLKMETSLGCWIASALLLLFPFIGASCIFTFICGSLFSLFGHKCVHYLHKTVKTSILLNHGRMRVDGAIQTYLYLAYFWGNDLTFAGEYDELVKIWFSNSP